MSSRFHRITRAAAISALLVLSSQALPSRVLAQSDDADLEMRVQQLENQLRQLTGQNEELQYRNRQLEERLRQLQGGQPGVAQPNVAAAPPVQASPVYRQPDQQIAAPAPIVQEPPAVAPGVSAGRVQCRLPGLSAESSPRFPGGAA